MNITLFGQYYSLIALQLKIILRSNIHLK